MTEDKQPVWNFDTPIKLARWLDKHSVKQIRFKHSDDGYGTNAKQWLEFCDTDYHTGKVTSVAKAPRDILLEGNELLFKPDHWQLVLVNPKLITRLEEIDTYKIKNKMEIATFKRLQKKYGNLK